MSQRADRAGLSVYLMRAGVTPVSDIQETATAHSDLWQICCDGGSKLTLYRFSLIPLTLVDTRQHSWRTSLSTPRSSVYGKLLQIKRLFLGVNSQEISLMDR